MPEGPARAGAPTGLSTLSRLGIGPPLGVTDHNQALGFLFFRRDLAHMLTSTIAIIPVQKIHSGISQGR